MYREIKGLFKCNNCLELNPIPINLFLERDYKYSKEVQDICRSCQTEYVVKLEQCEISA